MMKRKAEKIRLIDDSDFLIRRVKMHEDKPDAWFRSKDHLEWVATLSCIVRDIGFGGCRGGIEAAHLRIGTDGAAGEKPSDYFVSPQCAAHHRVSHLTGERSFWDGLALDPVKFVLRLATRSPCHKTVAAATAELQRRYGSTA